MKSQERIIEAKKIIKPKIFSEVDRTSLANMQTAHHEKINTVNVNMKGRPTKLK